MFSPIVILAFLLLNIICQQILSMKIFHNKDSSVFTRDQIDVNCSEPLCFGPFRDIYCQGPIIWAAWHFGLQKDCPGTRLKYDAKVVLHNFDRSFDRGKLYRNAFVRFCDENFDNRPYLEEADLPDWKPEPHFLQTIGDQKMRMFATEMHRIWPQLARRFVDDVHRNQGRFPFLAVPQTFIIPGNLVQMYYYWDSYWILRGVLLSDMPETAKAIIRNFAFVMRVRGHIPNSGMYIHSRRSQPPLFTQMVADYYKATRDKDFLEEILPSAERELDWWRKNRTINVRLANNEEYNVYRYKTMANCPRPEMLMLDYYYAMESARDDLQYIWSSTNSACESGWDFSTRWFSIDSDDEEMAYTRKGIRTNDILPLDLNVLMALNYRKMAEFYGKELENQRKAKLYELLADSLADAIEAVFRDRGQPPSADTGTAAAGVWFDYDLAKRRLRRRFFPTNIFPLILFSHVNKRKKQWEQDCRAAIDYMRNSGAVNFKGGLPSSMAKSSVEIWDFPNGSPRINHISVLALLKCSSVNADARSMAKRIADGLLTTSFNGLFHPRRGMPAQIWDKYDVRFEDGRSGFGGDYIPQTGFGSTNGALLELIRLFYTNSTGMPNNEEF